MARDVRLDYYLDPSLERRKSSRVHIEEQNSGFPEEI
jgi:hypothetical protein